MSTEQITIRLPTEYVAELRRNATAARRSLAAEVTIMLDQSPLRVNAAPDPAPDASTQATLQPTPKVAPVVRSPPGISGVRTNFQPRHKAAHAVLREDETRPQERTAVTVR